MRSFTFIPAVALLLLCTIAPDVSHAGITKRTENVEVTVDSYRFLSYVVDGGRLTTPEPGNIFLVVDVTVRNLRRTAIGVRLTHVYDDEGYKYEYMPLFPDVRGSLDGDVLPGRKLRGEVAFEVPFYAKGLEFAFGFSFDLASFLAPTEVRFPLDSYGVLLRKQQEREKQERIKREKQRQAQARALVGKGDEHLEIREYKKALEQYQAAIAMDKGFELSISDKIAKCYHGLGEHCFGQKDYQRAKEYYLLAVERDPSIVAELRFNLTECYLSIGDGYFGREDFGQALQNYETARNTDRRLEPKVVPRLGNVYLAIGKQFQSEDGYGDALALYQKSLKYMPNGREARYRIEEINNMRKSPALTGLLSIVPGVGQLSLGQSEKAICFFCSAAGLAGVSVFYLLGADSKYEKYEKTTNPSDAQRLHKETMDNYKISLVAAGIGAYVVVYSMYDAYVGATVYNQRFEPTSESGRYSINVIPMLSEKRILLVARIQF